MHREWKKTEFPKEYYTRHVFKVRSGEPLKITYKR